MLKCFNSFTSIIYLKIPNSIFKFICIYLIRNHIKSIIINML